MIIDNSSRYRPSTLLDFRAEQSLTMHFSSSDKERDDCDAGSRYAQRRRVTAGMKADRLEIRQFAHILPDD